MVVVVHRPVVVEGKRGLGGPLLRVKTRRIGSVTWREMGKNMFFDSLPNCRGRVKLAGLSTSS